MMSNRAVHRFAYRGWQVAVRLNGLDAKGAIAAHAEVQLNGSRTRRIVIDEPYRDCSTALRRLAQRARSFVDNCQTSLQQTETPHATRSST